MPKACMNENYLSTSKVMSQMCKRQQDTIDSIALNIKVEFVSEGAKA
jgi:hypothetical protein